MPVFVIVVDLIIRAVWVLAYGVALLIVGVARSVLHVIDRRI